MCKGLAIFYQIKQVWVPYVINSFTTKQHMKFTFYYTNIIILKTELINSYTKQAI